MAYEFENESGEVGTYYSPEELEAQKAEAVAAAKAEADAKLAEAEAHYKTKVDEFTKGKKAVEEKESTVDTKIAEAMAIAEASKKEVEAIKADNEVKTKAYLMQQVVGTDPELLKKLEDSYSKFDASIPMQERIQMAAEFAKLGSVQATPSLGAFSGGYAPTFNTADEKAKEEDHKQFVDALGIGNLLNNK